MPLWIARRRTKNQRAPEHLLQTSCKAIQFFHSVIGSLTLCFFECTSFLRQPHSRARLDISSEALKLLLHHLQALPELVNVITNFASEDGPYSEGRGGFYSRIRPTQNGQVVFETCYLLKHVELNGRRGPNPWSVRQMGVYQKFNIAEQRGKCILIQPSLELQRRLQEELDDGDNYGELIDEWMNVHSQCINTLSRNWLAYIKFLEKEVAKIVSPRRDLNQRAAGGSPDPSSDGCLNHSKTPFASPRSIRSKAVKPPFETFNRCTTIQIFYSECAMYYRRILMFSMLYPAKPKGDSSYSNQSLHTATRHSKRSSSQP
jgi:hypothetical protein